MLLNLERGGGPLYRRIYDALKSAIREGRIGAEERLPSTRALAQDLRVSRNTVLLAYEQLAAEGYLAGNPRSSTRVARALGNGRGPEGVAPKDGPPRLSRFGLRLARDPTFPPSMTYAQRPGIRYDFRYGRPAIQDFPLEAWRRLLAARTRRAGPSSYGYAPPEGYEPLRVALADYLRRTRGVLCNAEQLVIVSGSQQAFDLVGRVLLNPGDAVAIEEPHYSGSSLVFESLGARLLSVPVDAQGLDPARLPPARAGARIACVTPCHQFPTGVILPQPRRRALLDWAARTGAWIVEDDYVSEFRYEGRPIEALQSLDTQGRVIHVGSLSKTLFPALRLGYLVLPRPLVRPFAGAKWLADRHSPQLMQEVLTDFIVSGRFERSLRRTCARNGERRRTLIEALREQLGERVEIAGGNAGVHLLVWLNDVAPARLPALIEHAAASGVGLYPITPYYRTPPRRAGLMFGYASLSVTDIRAGIRRLAQCLHGGVFR